MSVSAQALLRGCLDPSVVAALVVAGAMTFAVLPLGPAGKWVLSYRSLAWSVANPGLLIVGTICGLALIPVASACRRLGVWQVVALMCGLSIGLNLFLSRPLTGQVWLPRIIGTTFPHSNPFFYQAVNWPGISSFLEEDFERARAGYWSQPVHERRLVNYPPGLPTLYHGLVSLARHHPDASAAIARASLWEMDPTMTRRGLQIPADDALVAAASLACGLNLLLVGLLPFGVFLVASHLGSRENATRAAAQAALIPSCHLFVAAPDALLPAIGLTAVWTAFKSLEHHRHSWIAANVLLLAIGTALSYAMVPIIVMVSAILSVMNDRVDLQSRLRVVSWWAGFGCAVIAVALLVGAHPIRRFMLAVSNNSAFYSGSGRGWLESMMYNCIEFAVFGGVVWSVAWLSRLKPLTGCKIKSWLGPVPKSNRFSLIFMGLMLFLVISGSTRLEVGRNWMLLMPYLVIVTRPGALHRAEWQRRMVVALVVMVTMAATLECTFNF